MHFITALATSFALANLARCSDITDLSVRSWPEPVSPAPLPKRQGSNTVVQIVNVSDNNGTLKFFPENVVADVGSIVQFQFYPKNHTVTESSFAAPCMPMAKNLTTPERPGQRSGFVPVTADTQFRPIYNLIVNDTKPIWIFCGQMPHCQKGMAMVINQNMSSPDKTLENYKKAAAALPPPGASGSGAPPPPPGQTPPAAPPPPGSPVASGAGTTVTPAPAGNSGGPALAGSTTSSALIATFTSGPGSPNAVPAAGMLGLIAAGLVLL